MTKIQNHTLLSLSVDLTEAVLVIEYCDLEFICKLVLVIWYFKVGYLNSDRLVKNYLWRWEGPADPGPVDDNQLFDFDVNLLGNFDIGFGNSYL